MTTEPSGRAMMQRTQAPAAAKDLTVAPLARDSTWGEAASGWALTTAGSAATRKVHSVA